jgi:hypothetical protein
MATPQDCYLLVKEVRRFRFDYGSGQGDGGIVELFAEETFDEGFEIFAGLGEGEGAGGFGPVELVTSGLSGDPYLPDGGIRCDNEFTGTVFEDDVHDTVVVFELEGAIVVLCGDERLFEGFEGVVGLAAEGGFVDHGLSVTARIGDWGIGSLEVTGTAKVARG